MAACSRAAYNPMHKSVVDQITSVDDFMAFKKLMIKKNNDLNQEALKIMMKKEYSDNQISSLY